MDLHISGKVVLVTGSSHGIGLCIAKKFSEEGCLVAMNARNIKNLNVASLQVRNSFPYCADVTNPSEAKNLIKKIIKKFGKIDIIVCNVGSGNSVPPGQEDYEEWQRVLAENLFATTNIVKESRPYLKKSKGNIICISSICGIETVNGAPVTYSSAKAALNAYIKSIARPLGIEGIRINGIAPGNILFKKSSWDLKLRSNKKDIMKMIEENVSLQSFGDPEDIANLSCFLSSPLAKFASGSIWALDGGQLH